MYETSTQKPACLPKDAFMLIERGADVAAEDDMGRTALHWLCTLPEELDEDHQKLVTEIITRCPGLLNKKDNAGFRPFQIMARNPHVHLWLTVYLISWGIDPKEPDPEGNNILHFLAPKLLGEKTKALMAAENFKYLVSEGVPINHRNNVGATPIFNFITHSWEATRGPEGSSNPEWAIANDTSHAKALPLFLDAGVDLQIRNARGENLLHATAERWRTMQYVARDQEKDMLGIFKELMARGVDPRAEDERCRTAIDVAVASENGFLVDLFGVKGREVGVEDTEIGSEDEDEGKDEMIDQGDDWYYN